MTISIIVPCYNEEDNIIPFFNSLIPEITEYHYKLIFVDDGSKDNTLAVIKCLASKHKNIEYLSLSRNFGHQNALKAGYDFADADCVVCMDADLQHPPFVIRELVEKWKEGYEVVYTVRSSQENIGFVKKVTAKLFYKFLNYISKIDLPHNTSDFRLIDRKVLNAIKLINEDHLFFRGLIAWAGFKQYGLEYRALDRFSGKSKYSLRKMFSFSLVSVTSFSVSPLRISSLIGFFFSGLSFLYIFYALYKHVFTNDTVAGWTSLIVTFLFITGLQFIMIGIIGEYIGKGFMEAKKRPNYLISEKRVSENVTTKISSISIQEVV